MACTSTTTLRANRLAKQLAGLLAKLLPRQLACLSAILLLTASSFAASVGTAGVGTASSPQPACKGRLFLTFDTGNMSQAQFIADTLRQHHIKASFFLANEKTTQNNYALDPAWGNFWRKLAQDGHAFGSHTFQHTRMLADLPNGLLQVTPQFGAQAGRKLQWGKQQMCAELDAVEQAFYSMTGQHLDPIWRAPAGKNTTNSLAFAQQCGYHHFGWAQAGFSGDELSSERFPSSQLLAKLLAGLKDGDIIMAHLGIWSRKDAWAPAVLPSLLRGLQAKGFCFATLREHPAYPQLPHSTNSPTNTPK